MVSAQTGYTSLGCFNDNSVSPALRSNEGRGFPSLDGTASTRTDSINKCYQIAFQLAHTVFGLQNGACFSMADVVPGGDYARYGTASSCPSDGRGGTLINHVYQVTGAANYNPDYSTLPYTSLDCWKDSASNRALRPLEGGDLVLDSTPFARLNAVNKCYQAASFRGLTVFGISDGGSCWGAVDNVPGGDYARYNSSSYCPRDGKGASFVNHVYQIKNAPQASSLLNYSSLPYTSLGCWTDTSSVPLYALRLNEATSTVLDGGFQFRTDAVNKCHQVAESRGHNVFALKSGGQCYSMLDVIPGGSYAQYGSASFCPIDGRGGVNINNVFQIKNAPAAITDYSALPYTSLGCWNDNNNVVYYALRLNEGTTFASILDGASYGLRTDAINKCYQVAQLRGHNVFALKSGGQCYSMLDVVPGGSYAQYGNSSFCPRDGKGATNINHVYQVKNGPGASFDFSILPYTTLGCWNDHSNVNYYALRLNEGTTFASILDGASYGLRTDAINKCYQVAQLRGHNVFALKFGGQCYSMLDIVPGGSYAQYGLTTSAANKTYCPADGRGATNINHVYQIKNATGASFDFSTLPYTNLGCWNDNNNVNNYALRLNEGTTFATILDGASYGLRTDAINKCYQVAQLRGHNVFALKFGGQCYSMLDVVPGGSYAQYGLTTSAANKTYCPADGRGATNINHVYQIKNATGASFDFSTLPYTNLGCWNDNSDVAKYALRLNEGTTFASILDGASYGLRTDAVDKCYQVAQLRGHNVFALKFGGQCYSMLDVVGGGYSMYGASFSCPVDGKGGINSNNVYLIKNATALSFDWSTLPYSSLGCYLDSSNVAFKVLGANEGTSPILDGAAFWNRTDAINKCYQVAQSRGHNVFGLQNSGSCYSSFDVAPGGDYMRLGRSSFCPYDGLGGININHVYRINNATGRVLTFADLPYRSGLAYYSLGCWNDANPKALTSQEGTDPILDGSFGSRVNAVFKCYQVAVKRGHNVFGVQNGGQCYSRLDTVPNGAYAQYGRATVCPLAGKGALNVNNIYRVVA